MSLENAAAVHIKVKLDHKTPIVLKNLKSYDSHLTMQELGKFDFVINATPYGLEKDMSFSINNNLIFKFSIS